MSDLEADCGDYGDGDSCDNEGDEDHASDWEILLTELSLEARKKNIFCRLGTTIESAIHFLSSNIAINDVVIRFINDYEETHKEKAGKNEKLADELYEKALCLFHSGHESEGRKQLIEAQLLVPCGSSLEKKVVQLQSKSTEPNKPARPLPVLVSNPTFPSASKALQVLQTAEKGRHVVCAQNVKMGDLLFVETPHAALVNKPLQTKFCHQCCLRVDRLVVCSSCSEVVYCSESCRALSWLTCHRMECGYLTFLQTVGVAHLALRCLFSAGSCQQLQNQIQAIEQQVQGGAEGGIGYRALYGLQFHQDHLEPEELFQYAMTAMLLTLYLEKNTGYFPANASPSTRQTVGRALMRHILQLIVNAHAVIYNCLEPDRDDASLLIVTSPRVATGIYPSTAMMNHSCEPNVVTCFFGNVLVVHAARDLQAGDEVYNCYGPDYRRMVRHERLRLLQEQYNFQCRCRPCALPYDIMEVYSAFRCHGCRGPVVSDEERGICMDCGKGMSVTFEMNAQLGKVTRVVSRAAERNGVTLEELLGAWHAARLILYHSHRLVVALADQIARHLAIRGQFLRSLLVQSAAIVCVRMRYGEPSAAVVGEMTKLSQVAEAAAHQLGISHPNAWKYLEESKRYAQDAEKQCILLYGHNELHDDVYL